MNRRRKFLGGSVLVLLLLLGVVLVSAAGGRSFGGRLNEAQRARAEKSGHYEAGRFVNLVPTLNLAEGRAGVGLGDALFYGGGGADGAGSDADGAAHGSGFWESTLVGAGGGLAGAV
ncbi:MAG: hypothetical protein ACKO6N_16130 [Myxococcota bacterium]